MARAGLNLIENDVDLAVVLLLAGFVGGQGGDLGIGQVGGCLACQGGGEDGEAVADHSGDGSNG